MKRAAVVHVVQEDITIVPFVENNFLSIMKSDWTVLVSALDETNNNIMIRDNKCSNFTIE